MIVSKADKPDWVSDATYRKSKRDYVYYNSDLSKYIGDELPKVMTSMDIDIAQHKISKNLIRVAEYKHPGEATGSMQNRLLREIANVFRWAMDNGYQAKFECGIIRGEYPYESIEYEDYINNTKTVITGDDVKNFLTLEHE